MPSLAPVSSASKLQPSFLACFALEARALVLPGAKAISRAAWRVRRKTELHCSFRGGPSFFFLGGLCQPCPAEPLHGISNFHLLACPLKACPVEGCLANHCRSHPEQARPRPCMASLLGLRGASSMSWTRLCSKRPTAP